MNPVLMGILLSLIAGLATALGGASIFFIKDLKKKHLAFFLAFAVGVMLSLSFIELLPEGIEEIGFYQAIIFFFLGTGIAFLIDFFIPHNYIMEKVSKKPYDPKVFRVGLFSALGLAIHNFPEGIAVFVSTLHSPQLGILIAIGIAIHNIPEGICVSMPVYYATKKKKKAFFISFLSGIVQPIGAILTALILLPFISPQVIGASLALAAGIMVFICFDELLPTAYECTEGKHHLMVLGFLTGSIIMALTLMLLPH